MLKVIRVRRNNVRPKGLHENDGMLDVNQKDAQNYVLATKVRDYVNDDN